MTPGAVLSYVLFALLVFLLAYYIATHASFKRDARNPYRRYCKRCGQRQELHEQCGRLYWVDMGCVADTGCNCHLYAE